MKSARYDVVIVGAGIVGLAHALAATRRGLRVAVLERHPAACGASIRNFGMIWPVGQPGGEPLGIALRTRELWLELAARDVLEVEECGAICLAHHEDELEVLREFAAAGTHPASMLSREQVLSRTSLAQPEGLLGGMYSPTDCRVDPRTASARIAAFLAHSRGVDISFGTTAVAIEGGAVRAADGRAWEAGRILVCSGSDLRTLYPDVLAESGLILCKLQMLRSVAQPRVGTPPHLASGLSLRHYASFAGCPSLPALKARVAAETPELDRFGVHVMASQFPGGEVVLGDSHEYGGDITPFDRTEIEDLILRECRKVFRLDDWTVRERWHGILSKHPERLVFEHEPEPGVHLFVGTGGAGMTLSLGLADRAWDRWTRRGTDR
ncbi:hydroxyglutarate oxidase [Aquisphaera giovannonii]|uniref:Hydroxyglutarate oxidase n=1 Tax=Aquisphaera giovannonii TaxID=406548 RepID=A0A5B9VZV8_9BACT|nr:TIGR03364 family FAD-dependent oxidoreductase [Aquisphaera giovannonii]QEH33521.1 hydroxyglutarate oxidase [Aquisphaera giovannonii]